MRIGELARRAGVSASCIRFYEARGLLPTPPRLAGGYRDYDEQALATLVFIARARDLGFGLPAIAAHLASPNDGSRKTRLKNLLESMVEAIDVRMQRLADQRRTLTKLIAEVMEQQADKEHAN